MTYILIYIPFINTLFSSTLPQNLTTQYSIVFLIIMVALFVTDRLSLFKVSYLRHSSKPIISYKAFEISIVALFFVLVFLNRNNLSYFNMFSESDELYAFREGEALAKSGGTLGLYLLLWMENVFLPILLVCSYKKQQKFKFYAYLFSFIINRTTNNMLYSINNVYKINCENKENS